MSDKELNDILEKLIGGTKISVVDACAKVAEIHHIYRPENDFQRGINEAVIQISTKIRELNDHPFRAEPKP